MKAPCRLKLIALVAISLQGLVSIAQSATVVAVDGLPVHPTRILARFHGKGVAAQNAGVLNQQGLGVLDQSQLVPGLVTFDLSDANAIAAAAVRPIAAQQKELLRKIDALRRSGLFEYVEPDYLVNALALPSDAAFTDGTLWGLRNTGQSSGVAGVDIGAISAWDITTGSTNVIVAVIDTGVRYTHQDLAAQMWVNPGEIPANGIDDDGDGYVDDVHGINAITGSGDPFDDHNHGTHVSGTIGAMANNGGLHVGVTWRVRLMGCKFLDAGGFGATSDAIRCIDFATVHGARIMNNSWGGGGFSQALYDSIFAARNAGVLFVAAAQNNSSDNDVFPAYPASYQIDNIVSVAAIDRTGALAWFSNFGRNSVHLGAPGVAIYSSTAESDTSYDYYDGTSMATPHVAGVAALLMAQFPGTTLAEIKQRLLAGTVPTTSLANTITGGRANAYNSLVLPAGNLEITVSPPNGAAIDGGSNVIVRVTVTDFSPVTNATVTAIGPGGTNYVFLNNGMAPDNSANDHIYSRNISTAGGVTNLPLTIVVTAPGKRPSTNYVAYSFIVRPPNDKFVNRIVLTGATNSTSGSNTDATKEAGEPLHAGNSGGKSIWWSWTAPSAGAAVVDTIGSFFDTILGVYTGTTVTNLTAIASDDDSGGGLSSRVTFNVISGMTYQIAVDGYSGDSGQIQLHVGMPDLAGHWKLDDGSGTAATDSSGRGQHGALVNGPVWTNGQCHGALSFDGVNDYVRVPDADVLEFAGTSFTVALWVKTAKTSAQMLVEKQNSGFSGEFLFAINRDNSRPGKFSVCTGSDWIDSNFQNVANGQWHHLAVTYDRTTFRLYRDGLLDKTQRVSAVYTTSSLPLNFGRFATGNIGWPFQGQMDDVRRYNRALSSNEIAALIYCDEQPPPVISGIVRSSSGTPIGGVVVDFSNGGGTTTTDSSGNYTRPVPHGWSGTATPSLACYTFSPASRTYSNVTGNQSAQDYTGTARTVTISGTVRTASGTPISGVIISFSNAGGTATTDSNGNYNRSVPCGWSGTATPSASCTTFSPSSRNYSNVTVNQTGQDYTGTAGAVSISGTIRTGSGTPLSGVTLSFSNGGGSTTTDSSGNYSRSLPCGWTGTATPSASCYTFSPPSRSYSNVTASQSGQDYTGTASTFTISGTVRNTNGTPLSGVNISFSNGGSAVTTDGSGNYSQTVSCGWSGTATPSLGGYTFTPSSRTYSNVMANQPGQHYAGSTVPNSCVPDYVGNWKLDDGSGLMARDSSSNANHGTLLNGPTWTAGRIGGALNFDGVNDYVRVPDADVLEFANRNFTVALWVRTSRTGAQALVEKQHTGFNGFFLLALNRDNAIPGGFSVFTGNNWFDSNFRGVPDGQWHHLAVTFDGTAFRLYRDGLLDATLPGRSYHGLTTFPLNFGRFATGNIGWPFQGQMDDIRRYNRALSTSEISGLLSCPSMGAQGLAVNENRDLNSLRLETPQRLADGTIALRFQGVSGQRYQIFTSTDLQGWNLWKDFTAETDRIEIVDPEAATMPMRFFKLVVP